VRLGLLFKLRFQSSQFIRELFGKIDAFRVIIVEVVKFPGILIEGLGTRCVSCESGVGVGQFCLPSVVIDRP
jgi:hypothetical protein